MHNMVRVKYLDLYLSMVFHCMDWTHFQHARISLKVPRVNQLRIWVFLLILFQPCIPQIEPIYNLVICIHYDMLAHLCKFVISF